MITKLLRRALGQAFSQAPKATKAARRVGVPTRDAGIVGRVGPGGGGLETGVVARPITRPSSVNVRPNNTPYTGTLQPNTAPSYLGSQTSSPNLLQRAGGLLPTGPLGYLGRGLQVLGGVDVANKIRKGDYTGAAVEAALLAPGKTLGAARGLLSNPAGLTAAALVGTEALAPASVADGTFAPGSAGYDSLDPLERRRLYAPVGDMDTDDAVVVTDNRNVFDSDTRPVPPRVTEPPVPTREELEKRAYQQEVSRVAQQADPFFRAGGAPVLNYSADEGMAISRGLYGDQLTPNTPNPLMAGLVYDETNPMMQGRNYNMENPVGVQQSSAQSLADYYRNGMMEQQTQGMGSEPGLESVLSPEDREMFLQQLSSFRPGGPG
jgi:hypothetical protein